MQKPQKQWKLVPAKISTIKVFFFLYQRRVTIKNMSNPKNNNQSWRTWHKFKEKIDYKIKKNFGLHQSLAIQSDHANF